MSDWKLKAAEQINDEFLQWGPNPTKERIAEIIALHAEPLETLLLESHKSHDEDCDAVPGETGYEAECNCGATSWNNLVDSVLPDIYG